MYLNADDLPFNANIAHWPDRITPTGGLGIPWYNCYSGDTNHPVYGAWGNMDSPYVGYFRNWPTNENCGGLGTAAATCINGNWSVFAVFRPDARLIATSGGNLLEGGTSGHIISTGDGRIQWTGGIVGNHIISPTMLADHTYTFLLTQNTNTGSFSSYLNGVQYTNISFVNPGPASDGIFQPGEFRFYHVAFRWSGYIKITALYSNAIPAITAPKLDAWVRTVYPAMFP